jgi:hypothetical protein
MFQGKNKFAKNRRQGQQTVENAVKMTEGAGYERLCETFQLHVLPQGHREDGNPARRARDAEQMRSRVEVTKFICDYIKSNNLQNPQDRRQIVPDSKLCKLLDFKPVKDGKDKDGKALTYYYLQQKIQPHFVQA